MSITRRQHVVNNHILSVLEGNPEQTTDSRTIVFLHGWGSEANVWKPLMESFVMKGFRCVAPDLPGFGQSEFPHHSFSVDDYTIILRNLLFQCEVGEYVLIAHSFGGRIAIKHAATAPSFLNKIILTGAAGVVLNNSKRSFISSATSLGKRIIPSTLAKKIKKNYYNSIGSSEALAIPELEETFKRVVGEDLTNELIKITVPTLLIWGQKDDATPIEQGRVMLEKIPSVSMQIYPEAGHYAFIDEPERFEYDAGLFISPVTQSHE